MAEFKTDSVFEALRRPLDLVEDPSRRQAFERYVEAARIPIERAIFDLLSILVDSVNEKIADAYQVRLNYRPGGLEVDVQPVAAKPGGEERSWFTTEGEVEKVTIRIPAELKELIVQASSQAGTSLNSWFIRTLARTLRDLEERPQPQPPHRPHGPHRRGPGARLSGWMGGE